MIRDGFGEPFPPLPDCLLGAESIRQIDPSEEGNEPKMTKADVSSTGLLSLWAQQDLNLRLRPCEERTLPLSYAPSIGC